ncbi:MAG TPA: hypothetical protein VN577_13215 [Terriglobales bacterium]|nr:hypothetical protein [Terriglobales bacterium]
MNAIATAPAPSKPNRGRSIGAILAGFVVVVVLSTLTDVVMYATKIFPAPGSPGQPMSDALFALSTLYRTVYTVLGGYITARLAPNRPVRHAIILGFVGIVVGSIGAAATWNRNMGPHWYAILLVVLAVPSCWVGARLFARGGE